MNEWINKQVNEWINEYYADDEAPSVVSCPDSLDILEEGAAADVSWEEPQFEEPHGFNLTVQVWRQKVDMLYFAYMYANM